MSIRYIGDMMQIIKPNYYDEFYCAADKCSFTCCQEWQIGLEGEVTLGADHKCELLREDGLCSLVLKEGEEALSETCHIFPRQRQEYTERIEHALSPACPVVVELLWNLDTFETVPSEQLTSMKDETSQKLPQYDKVYGSIRDWFMDIVSDTDRQLSLAMKMVFYFALDIKDMKEQLNADNFNKYRCSDIVERAQETIASIPSDESASMHEQIELFLDVAYNYRKKNMYSDYIEPLAQTAEIYIDDMSSVCEVKQFSMLWHSIEDKMRVLICEEIYAGCLTAFGDIDDMLNKLEWIAMEYSVVKAMLFLHWKQTGTLGVKDIIQLITIVFRMMGYNDEDIEEYLNENFESNIWDWGYFALIIA